MHKTQDDKGNGKLEVGDGDKPLTRKLITSSIQCQKCQGMGHKAFECPSRKTIQIREH